MGGALHLSCTALLFGRVVSSSAADFDRSQRLAKLRHEYSASSWVDHRIAWSWLSACEMQSLAVEQGNHWHPHELMRIAAGQLAKWQWDRSEQDDENVETRHQSWLSAYSSYKQSYCPSISYPIYNTPPSPHPAAPNPSPPPHPQSDRNTKHPHPRPPQLSQPSTTAKQSSPPSPSRVSASTRMRP
jgi:hypothetical protein